MGRIKHKWVARRRDNRPLTFEQERAALLAQVARLEKRIKTRDEELVKEYKRRHRQQERVNLAQRALSMDGTKQRAIAEFAPIFAAMMADATDNRVCEALMQIGPHTISDMRIGGDIDEEKQPPVLWLTLPELEIRIRVDERIWPRDRMSRAAAEMLIGRPIAMWGGGKG